MAAHSNGAFGAGCHRQSPPTSWLSAAALCLSASRRWWDVGRRRHTYDYHMMQIPSCTLLHGILRSIPWRLARLYTAIPLLSTITDIGSEKFSYSLT